MTDPYPDHPAGKMLWTRPILEKFKAQYEAAVAQQQDQFDFTATLIGPNGPTTVTQPVLTAYAKYAIEYYDRILKP